MELFCENNSFRKQTSTQTFTLSSLCSVVWVLQIVPRILRTMWLLNIIQGGSLGYFLLYKYFFYEFILCIIEDWYHSMLCCILKITKLNVPLFPQESYASCFMQFYKFVSQKHTYQCFVIWCLPLIIWWLPTDSLRKQTSTQTFTLPSLCSVVWVLQIVPRIIRTMWLLNMIPGRKFGIFSAIQIFLLWMHFVYYWRLISFNPLFHTENN